MSKEDVRLGKSKNLWDAALQEVSFNKKQTSTGIDKYVLLMGTKSVGKTTALLKFLARDENPKPTTALEYTFARRTTNLQQTLIAHIWELGGGTNLEKLLEIPFNIDSFKQMTVVLMLDLSQPTKLWYTAEMLIKSARQRLDGILKIANKQNPGFEDEIVKKAWARIGGQERPDSDSISPFPVPLLIVGGKYDLFQVMDGSHKQVITQSIRYLAHVHGATALFFSDKIESTVRGWKHIMNAAAFDSELSKTPVIDATKPLYVPCGMDTISGIGPPPMVATDVGKTTGKSTYEAWKISFNGHFPQETDTKQKPQDDPARDPQFKEPRIDELRAQKDRELEAYKRQESQKWTSKLM